MFIGSQHFLRSSFFLIVAALLALSSLAYAQDGDGAGDGADVVVSEEDEAFDEQEGEVIIMTGSAIERRGLTTAAPLAIVDKSDLDAAGMASVGEILQNLPSQSNAINVNFNNGGDGSTRVNLRGLGAGRTLVLVNGRRHVAGGTGANASVDLNAIPLAVIDRVEVLKDGASAIYGSDAIGGVVNIITRKDFQGTEASGYYGSTQDGKGSVYDINVAAGIDSERGNVVFSAGYFQQNPLNAGDRGFSTTDKFYDWEASQNDPDGNPDRNDVWYPNGSSAPPHGYLNDRLGVDGNELWQDVIANSCTSGVCRLDNLTDFQFPGDTGLGDLYNYQPENYLVTPQKRYNAYASGSYKLSKNVNAFFESSYLNRTSDQQLAPTPLFIITEGLTVDENNFYNPFGRPFIDIRRRFVEAGNRRFYQDLDTFRIVGGLEGTLSDDLEALKGWRWNLAYNYGRTAGLSINEGRFVRSRVEQALGPSYMGADGNPRCGTMDNPGDADCVPLNLFGGEGTITQEMIDYISYTGIGEGFNEQKSWTFNTSGRLFKTPWGGDVALATGFEYRSESGAFIPDPITESGDTTGNKGEATEGGFDVYEAFGELSIVPIAGKPLAEWLEINVAARTSTYSSFGNQSTWKAGGLWRIQKGVSIRGTYSTAFRAPSIGALFSGQSDAFPNVTDPCDTSMGPRSPAEQANCAADGLPDDYVDDRTQIRAREGGNPNLEPETAKILTAGAVYEPHMVPGLAFTIDYFNVEVDNAIAAKGASLLLSNCYEADTAVDRQDCDTIIRDPSTGFITNIIDTATNIGGNETSGVDFSVRYQHNTTVGLFRHNLEGTWLQKYDAILPTRTVVGRGVYDLGVFPEWKFNFATQWAKDNLSAGLNARYIHSFRECEDDDCRVGEDFTDENPEPLSREVDFNVTGDVFLSYSTKTDMGMTRVTVGMNNVLNQDPAVIFNGFLATSDASTYDFLGRYVYARLVQSF